MVNTLIEHGADVNATTHDGRSALYAAAYRGHAKVPDNYIRSFCVNGLNENQILKFMNINFFITDCASAADTRRRPGHQKL